MYMSDASPDTAARARSSAPGVLPTIQPFVRWPCSPPHGHRGGSLAVHTPCTPCGRPAWSLLSLGAAAARPLRPLERAGAAGRRCRPVRPQNSGENRCEPPPPRPERPAPLLWPGQGTAYKIGELRIQALRAQAQEALGSDFDLRAFHDVVVGNGSLAIAILEDVVEGWIEAQRAAL